MLVVPGMAAAALPVPTEIEVIDVPNDDGASLGVLWFWRGETSEDTRVTIEIEVARDIIDEYALTVDEADKLQREREALRGKLESILPAMYEALQAAGEIQARLQVAEANKDPDTNQIRREYWSRQREYNRLHAQREKLWEGFLSRTTTHKTGYLDRQQTADYIVATLNNSPWVACSDVEDAKVDMDGNWPTKGEQTGYFGQDPPEADKVFYKVSSFRVLNPAKFAGTFTDAPDDIDYSAPEKIQLKLHPNTAYNLRLVVSEGDEQAIYELGGGTGRVNFFNVSLVNNLIFAVGFGIIILVAIMLARRNPNMFIRRISGLEAVDEAIGRATEMGKPVLYLCGLDPLSTLSTLAAINILGRVARRIADYDSDLVVPQRDPVVLTVAQEVVREAYIDQGRPDAYKEDNIFFVTDDQFSFTATTCAIMMRDKPAANFFMGYYYAESLLLAETGAATGAIQIAGTDALHQLPFFITTCDYTLIGEELYAASAYLSREPLLLGSLKGQDLGKALIMLLIVVQSLLFAINADWNWLKMLVEPL
ncbi:hypothetical protein JW859_03310 [bacterium]|nr:hypothetical protein [bacterium]